MNSILLKLSDKQMDELDFVVNLENKSRADVIKEAIAAYIAQKQLANRKTNQEVFGLWKDKNIDGLEYQQRMRSEW